MFKKSNYSVAIVGGGPAGIAVATQLSMDGASTTILELSDYREQRIGEHIPPSGREIFHSLELADAINENNHKICYGVLAFWGSELPHHMDYIFHPYGYGLNLSRPLFDAKLAIKAKSLGVDIITRARIKKINRHSAGWEIVVSTKQREVILNSVFVVDASGRSASFARKQGEEINLCDKQVAIIGHFKTRDRLSTGIVTIEAVEHGWWYFATLSNGYSVCMFMTDLDMLGKGSNKAEQSWNHSIKRTQHIRPLLGPYVREKPLLIRSACSQRLYRSFGDSWLAVGDAAIAFDPLSSQGISKGMQHGSLAAKHIKAYLSGEKEALENYQAMIDDEFSNYERTRLSYYLLEKRWPHSKFWQRRHQTKPQKPINNHA